MYYPIALFAVILTAVLPGHRLRFRLPARLARMSSHPATVPLAVITLVLAQHAYLMLLLDATYHQHPMRDFMARMPVRFISGFAPETLGDNYRSGFALLALLESLALLALYVGLERVTRAKFAIVAIGVALACTEAAGARAATSADMYSYVGFTLLGTRAYSPPATAFAGAYGVINIWWHTPLVPAPYGPLWLATADATAALGHSLFTKIVALRILGAFSLLGTAGILTALKVPLRVTALVALNPALVFEFVANVHNDLFAVLLLLAARYATGRGSTRAAILFAVAAGLVKLPFLLFAALAFAPLASPVRRIRAFGISLILGLSASWLIGGRPYYLALYRHTNDSTFGHALSALLGAPLLLIVIALLALGLALARGIFIEGFAWALPALSALLHPWYLCWTLPYAVASKEALRNVAIALPVAMLTTDAALGNGTLITVFAGAAYLWLAVSLARSLVERRVRRIAT